MPTVIYDRNAPPKAVSLSLNKDLVSRTESLTQNLSATVETLPADYVHEQKARQSAEDERLDDVISALNARHEQDGLLSDEFPSL